MKKLKLELQINGLEKYLPQKEKKLVCFGAGTAGKLLLDILPKQYKIDFFTDNNEELWEKNIQGIKIIQPKYLVEIEDICVLIISRHIQPIKKQLEEMHIQYIDLYTPFEEYFRLSKALDITEQYVGFIKQIDIDLFNKTEIIDKQKIGIVVLPEASVQNMFFSITLYLLLKAKGCCPQLILDTLKSMIDIRCVEGLQSAMIQILKYILGVIDEKFGEQNYYWLKENTSLKLTEEDDKLIDINTRDTIKSFLAYSGDKYAEKDFNSKELYQKQKECIVAHYQSLHHFLQETSFDVIAVFNGLTEKRFNYTYVGHKFGIRIPSYDTYNWSTDYPSCWNYDLRNFEKFISKKRFDKFAKIGKAYFNKRKNRNVALNGFQQLKEYDANYKEKIDVLIPLNIMFDSAVLGLDRVFSSPEEWVVETVNFLVTNKNVKIVIKESPGGTIGETVNNPQYKEMLKEYIDGKKIRYISANEKENIYNLIENSKVILPYSSTVGIEAAIMNKPVIVHTNCFFKNEDFVITANTKKEYFMQIQKYIGIEEYEISNKSKAEAMFWLVRSGWGNNLSDFREDLYDWIKKSFVSLLKNENVIQLLTVIVDGKPLYQKNNISEEEFDMKLYELYNASGV